MREISHNRAGWLPDIEQRQVSQPVQLRSSQSGPSRQIGGYAVVFDVKSEPLGGFIEQIDRRCFNKTQGDGWPGVIARYNHSDDFLLGTVEGGTLQLSVDKTGLEYLVDLPQCRSDVLEMVGRGDVSKSSFAMRCYDDSWGFTDGQPLRTVLQARLIDVAPVNTPAYLQSSASTRDSTAALRSLARFTDAPIAEIIDLHNRDELRKLFVRTGSGPSIQRSKSGHVALIETMGRRWPAEPPRPKSPQERLTEINGKRWPDENASPVTQRSAP